MLSAKPWKPEAVLRLFLGVIVCVFVGGVILGAAGFPGGAGKGNGRVYLGLSAAALAFLAGVLFLVRKPWPMDRFARHFLGLLVCLYFGLTLTWFAQHFAGGPGIVRPACRVLIATLSFQGVTLVLIWRFLREHQTSWMDAFGFRNGAGLALLFGAAITCLYLPLGWGLQWASAQIMSHFGANPQAQEAVEALKNTEGWADRLAFGVAAIALVPVVEEMLFRGILYPVIKQAGFPRGALWGTSILFAAVHANLPAFVPLLLLALVLATLYERTNNLLAPIVAHAVFNAINLAVSLFWLPQIQDWLDRVSGLPPNL